MNWFAIVFGILPGIVWLFFYLQEDLHPEPKKLLIKTFLIGGLFAFLALLVELLADCSLVRNFQNCFEETSSAIPLSLTIIIVFSLIEEVAKFMGAFVSVHKNPAFNEPVDAMIYAVVASLGFATVENIGAIGLDASHGGFTTDPLEIIALRFIGATLLHTLASAAVGYYWALSIRDFGESRLILIGIAVATGLHALFNYLILEYGRMILPVLLLVVAGFFIIGDFEKLKRKNV
ncbi:MAG: hypothetical protein A2122_00045 [Candidatus Liptonbacteria bacterium GWB1_49_6]|uniref:Protease PrsW n=1 Tax=Candidatus Liptonbacteria bacterium GWB1_49_6 TaxID=1798644 RepID=A0A1G2C600_9BACT|nr:MAG: hypothetical protein A2122_00045 [Candidatus Liptonbacteria bacterium GWB1_49_6]